MDATALSSLNIPDIPSSIKTASSFTSIAIWLKAKTVAINFIFDLHYHLPAFDSDFSQSAAGPGPDGPAAQLISVSVDPATDTPQNCCVILPASLRQARDGRL